jgi:cytosine deaminase
MIDLLLVNATLPDGTGGMDLAVDGGRILARGPGLDFPARRRLDVGGRLLIPGFVESHLHLDVALMNDPLQPGRPAPFCSPVELNTAMEQRRAAFTRLDIERRAGLALEMASRHGVTAMRAQCHVDPVIGLKHLEALLAVRERYRSRIDLQIVAFPQGGLLGQAGTLDLFREAFRLGADVMGCAANLEPGGNAADPRSAFHRHIDAALALAMELNVDLDMHADLSMLPDPELADLEAVYSAQRALEVGYQGRVTAGHFCALDSCRPEVAQQAIEWVVRAGMGIISQPDLYRLGRADARHVRRGLTRVKQLLAAGATVAYASNNVRDAFRPLGNFDLLEEGLILAYGAHMDTIAELESLLQMSTFNAARILKLPEYGLEPGCRADLVILEAASASAAIVGQAEKLFVFKAGQLVAANRRQQWAPQMN